MKKGALLFSLWLAGGWVMAEVRAPQVAGQFYPADPEELRETVDGAIAAVGDIQLEGGLIALLSPHAGYAFSGAVQGYSYRPLQTVSFDTVVIIGTGHYLPTETGAVFDGTTYQTPLGGMEINSEFVSELLSLSPLFQANQRAHQKEHSVETQIPFLQRTLGSAKVVPIVMGNPSAVVCTQMGEVLARLIQKQKKQGKKILLIASSDLSHYPSDQDARTVDNSTLQALLTMNSEYFAQVNADWMGRKIPQLSCAYCGEGAVTTVIAAAKALGATSAKLLKYATSAEVPYGDRNRVVGYASVVFVKEEGEREESFAVSKQTQKVLLQTARHAVTEGVGATRRVAPTTDDPILHQPAAVFVTLKKNGQLRGCIGGTEARLPLSDAVHYFAAAAAFEDPRFTPVQPEELENLQIEISILSPLKRIRSAVEILPAVHGVVVKRGAQSGLFLPQVWVETGWTKEVFLDQLCSQKGGLPARSWQDPQTELSVFTVFSFEENRSVR